MDLRLNVAVAMERPRSAGFTLIELTIVILISSILTSIAFRSYGSYLDRTSSRRSAEMFSQDLTLARSEAVRARTAVTLLFDESAMIYVMRSASGDTLVTRAHQCQFNLILNVFNMKGTAVGYATGQRLLDLFGQVADNFMDAAGCRRIAALDSQKGFGHRDGDFFAIVSRNLAVPADDPEATRGRDCDIDCIC